jgi:hypothetical protein
MTTIDTAQIQKTLADELGLSNLPEDEQQQLIIKMTEIILKRIFLETMEKLDERGRNEYEKLVDGGATPEQIEEFLKSKISDYEGMMEKVVTDFRQEMIDEKF